MSSSPVLLIGLSSAYSSARVLSEKLAAYTSTLGDFQVIAVNDSRNLVAECLPVARVSSAPLSSSLVEKRRLVRQATWAIYFWDGTALADYVYLSLLYGVKTKVVPVETTRVANKERGDEFDVYIGRGTPWGNPFAIGDRGADRAEVIHMYREYFNKKFVEDPAGNKDIRSLKGKVLGCHCKPAACHGDIIAEYLNGLD